jgi:hypothetical protein
MASNHKIEFKRMFARKFPLLKDFQIVCICDDSGSMQKELSYKKGCSRWDELKETLTVILDLLYTKLQINTEVRFLNYRNGRKKFIYNGNKHELNANFAIKPEGSSQLTKALIEVRDAPAYQNKKLLIIMFTDGLPTEKDKESSGAIREFYRELVKNEGTQTYVSLVACTDEPGTVEYLNNFDSNMSNLDVNDDYNHERALVEDAQDAKSPLPVEFTYSDYIGKILLGSFVPEISKLDGN